MAGERLVVPDFGYQQIGIIIPEDGATHVEGKNRVIFKEFIASGVFKALTQSVLKTAIVLPMELIAQLISNNTNEIMEMFINQYIETAEKSKKNDIEHQKQKVKK